MAEEKKNLREALNEVEMVGVVADKDFYYGTNSEGVNFISGNIDIKVNDDIHRVAIKYTAEKTKEGKENKAYKGLVTIDEEVVTLKEDKDSATRVRLGNAAVTLNEYSTNGVISSFLQPQTAFIHRIKDSEIEQYPPTAKFKFEMLVSGTTPETKNNEETGDLILKGWVPIYGGKVFPVENLKVRNKRAVDYIADNYTKGTTVTVFGDIINKQNIETKEIETAFGENQVDKKVTTVREYQVTSGTTPKEFDEDEDNGAFDPRLMKDALAERDKHLEELKNKEKEKGKKDGKNSGAAKNGKSGKESPFGDKNEGKKANKNKDFSDDLPF